MTLDTYMETTLKCHWMGIRQANLNQPWFDLSTLYIYIYDTNSIAAGPYDNASCLHKVSTNCYHVNMDNKQIKN